MSRYGKILLCICLLDLLVTVLGIQLGCFDEANGLLSWALYKWGLPGLAVVKMIINLLCILPLETALRLKLLSELIIRRYYRLCIWTYVVGYAFFVWVVNFF